VRASFLAVEVCARFDLAPRLLEDLRGLVAGSPEQMTRSEAWVRHTAAADALLGALALVERGCWEYFDDQATAMSMFADWCRPVLDRVVPRASPSGVPSYREAAPRYLTFTIAVLLAHDSPSDLEVRRACDIPGADLWRRATFGRVLGAVRAVSFASVKADIMYLAPRDDDWGFTHEDLSADTYDYLRVVEDGPGGGVGG
jgi:hypothetical protein